MFGYVRPYEPELKVRELGVYQSYYCGLCKVIGMRYGQMLRAGLSYDLTFLALLLSSLEEKEEDIQKVTCTFHFMQKKTAVSAVPALEYAADMTAVLGYEKSLDDVRDKGIRGKVEAGIFLHFYKKASSLHPYVCQTTGRILQELCHIEEADCSSPDFVAKLFGKTLGEVFLGYPGINREGMDSRGTRALREFAENLGRWIYIIDAADDLEEDQARGEYNPLDAFARKNGDVLEKDPVRTAEQLLYHYLGSMASAMELLDFRKNRKLIENIIYLGLRQKTDEVLKREKEKYE